MSTHATGKKPKAWRKGELWLLATPLVLLLGIAIWNIAQPQLIKRMMVPRLTLTARHPISCVAYSPDGNIVAGGEGSPDLKIDTMPVAVNLWNARTGALINRLDNHKLWVKSVVFSPDGKSLASVSEGDSLRLYDVESGQPKWSLPVKDTKSRVAFTSDSEVVVVQNGTAIEVRDVATGRMKRAFSKPIVSIDSMVISPDDSMLAVTYSKKTPAREDYSKSYDQAITIWSLRSGREIKTIGLRSSTEIVFSRDGKLLLSCTGLHSWKAAWGRDDKYGGLIEAFDVASGKTKWSRVGGPDFSSLAVHPKNDLLVVGGMSNAALKFYDAKDGRFIKAVEPRRWLPQDMKKLFSSDSAFAFSPDGQTLASRRDNTIQLWDITSVLHEYSFAT